MNNVQKIALVKTVLLKCVSASEYLWKKLKKAGVSDSILKRIGVSGYNKPKRTPKHPTKSHVVVAKVGSTVKTIRFGQQGVTLKEENSVLHIGLIKLNGKKDLTMLM